MRHLFLTSPDHPAAYFDWIAPRYDEVWTNTQAGRSQRDAVWRQIDPLIRQGDRVLDIGCGTGEDALHFSRLGADVLAIDASPEMVRFARGRGVNTRLLRVERIRELTSTYELVLSNFGVFNCIRDLWTLREPLAHLLSPRGYLAVCLMSRFCLWESLHYALRGQLRKASRRWCGKTTASGGLRVYYPSATEVQNALLPGFSLVIDVGIGIAVPPSFAKPIPARLFNNLARLDARIGASKLGRTIGDHRLFVFRRS